MAYVVGGKEERIHKPSRCAFLLAATFVLGVGAFGQVPSQRQYSDRAQQDIHFHLDPKRDEWQKPDEVVRKLQLRSGDAVADLGSGPGYFTLRLAQAVGPAGKVYAVDLDAGVVNYVKERAA